MADDWTVHTNPVKLYLCDRQRVCMGSPYCGNECKHTRDYHHAKNRIKEEYEMKFKKSSTKDLWEVENG